MQGQPAGAGSLPAAGIAQAKAGGRIPGGPAQHHRVFEQAHQIAQQFIGHGGCPARHGGHQQAIHVQRHDVAGAGGAQHGVEVPLQYRLDAVRVLVAGGM
ncbi:hypothetical protein ABB31_01440 [Stenotrophomonas pavanii]|nr:hypothetical protein ABB31_01440 [Stenotrophomonas pavanii]